jgi:UDPglucose 6-dehydrogenase
MDKPSISVIGLGKLGLPIALCLREAGYRVIGLDLNEDLLNKIEGNTCPYYEANLAEYMTKYHMVTSHSYVDTILNTDISFIIVPTPSNPEGDFSNKYIESAIRSIGGELKKKTSYHLVVINSTVMPGTTEKMGKILKEYTNNFGICYNPEFVALGNVIHDFKNPDLVLIGESDKKAGDILQILYDPGLILMVSSRMKRMSLWNAEVAKIALNAYLTMKMSFANILAEICEEIPGGNVDDITEAIGLDSRIGRKYLKGALAYGGPCFPRDNRAFMYFAKNSEKVLAEATDEVNRLQQIRLSELVVRILGGTKGKKVAILGCTYKPDSDLVDESVVLDLVEHLVELGVEVSLHDPAGSENAKKILGDICEYETDKLLCMADSDLVIVAVPWSEYKSLKPEDFNAMIPCPVVLDCWRIYDGEEFREAGIEYHAIGINK